MFTMNRARKDAQRSTPPKFRQPSVMECLESRTLLSGTWETVPLGGGGYVTGMASNANGSAIYIRTDVGGAFRWAASGDAAGNGSWVPLGDDLVPYTTPNASSTLGTDSIATDPANPNRVYIGAGNALWTSDNK